MTSVFSTNSFPFSSKPVPMEWPRAAYKLRPVAGLATASPPEVGVIYTHPTKRFNTDWFPPAPDIFQSQLIIHNIRNRTFPTSVIAPGLPLSVHWYTALPVSPYLSPSCFRRSKNRMCFFQFFRSDPRDLSKPCLIGFFTVQYLTDQPFAPVSGRKSSKKHLTIQLFIRHFFPFCLSEAFKL